MFDLQQYRKVFTKNIVVKFFFPKVFARDMATTQIGSSLGHSRSFFSGFRDGKVGTSFNSDYVVGNSPSGNNEVAPQPE